MEYWKTAILIVYKIHYSNIPSFLFPRLATLNTKTGRSCHSPPHYFPHALRLTHDSTSLYWTLVQLPPSASLKSRSQAAISTRRHRAYCRLRTRGSVTTRKVNIRYELKRACQVRRRFSTNFCRSEVRPQDSARFLPAQQPIQTYLKLPKASVLSIYGLGKTWPGGVPWVHPRGDRHL